MKQLLLICAVVALVGCGKKEAPEPQEKEAPKAETEKTKKPSNPEENLGSSYVWGTGGGKMEFLENGKALLSFGDNDDSPAEVEWKIVGDELHVIVLGPVICRIEPNGDLQWIAEIKDGKRKEVSPFFPPAPFKKIK